MPLNNAVASNDRVIFMSAVDADELWRRAYLLGRLHAQIEWLKEDIADIKRRP